MIMLKILIIIIITSGLNFAIGTSTPKLFDAGYIANNWYISVSGIMFTCIHFNICQQKYQYDAQPCTYQ